MTNDQPTNQPHNQTLKQKSLIRFLSVLVLILAVLTAAIPGALTLMRRADAQVALGNAKSLRMALEAASTEAYGAGEPFYSSTSQGGVTKEVWQQVILNSKVPGDFWVIKTDESGYEVERFLYREGDFVVSYSREPLSYEVYYQKTYIQTEFHAVY